METLASKIRGVDLTPALGLVELSGVKLPTSIIPYTLFVTVFDYRLHPDRYTHVRMGVMLQLTPYAAGYNPSININGFWEHSLKFSRARGEKVNHWSIEFRTIQQAHPVSHQTQELSELDSAILFVLNYATQFTIPLLRVELLPYGDQFKQYVRKAGITAEHDE